MKVEAVSLSHRLWRQFHDIVEDLKFELYVRNGIIQINDKVLSHARADDEDASDAGRTYREVLREKVVADIHAVARPSKTRMAGFARSNTI